MVQWTLQQRLQLRACRKREHSSHLEFTELQKWGHLDGLQDALRYKKIQPQPHGGTAQPRFILFPSMYNLRYTLGLWHVPQRFISPLFGRVELARCQVGFIRQNDVNGNSSLSFFFTPLFNLSKLKGLLTPNQNGKPTGMVCPSCGPGAVFPASRTLFWAAHPRALAVLCT